MSQQLFSFGDEKDFIEIVPMIFGLESNLLTLNIENVGPEILRGIVTKQPISRNYRGLCPFHREKTPSFFVDVKWNRFICYGCGLSGGPLILPFDLQNSSIAAKDYFSRKLGIDWTNPEECEIFSRYLKQESARFESSSYYRFLSEI